MPDSLPADLELRTLGKTSCYRDSLWVSRCPQQGGTAAQPPCCSLPVQWGDDPVQPQMIELSWAVPVSAKRLTQQDGPEGAWQTQTYSPATGRRGANPNPFTPPLPAGLCYRGDALTARCHRQVVIVYDFFDAVVLERRGFGRVSLFPIRSPHRAASRALAVCKVPSDAGSPARGVAGASWLVTACLRGGALVVSVLIGGLWCGSWGRRTLLRHKRERAGTGRRSFTRRR